jgi:hypothetical protein
VKKDIDMSMVYDLALAYKLNREKKRLYSTIFLPGRQGTHHCSIPVPNQGGKQPFARMFGQLHFLASLGCPSPERSTALTSVIGCFPISRNKKIPITSKENCSMIETDV